MGILTHCQWWHEELANLSGKPLGSMFPQTPSHLPAPVPTDMLTYHMPPTLDEVSAYAPDPAIS